MEILKAKLQIAEFEQELDVTQSHLTRKESLEMFFKSMFEIETLVLKNLRDEYPKNTAEDDIKHLCALIDSVMDNTYHTDKTKALLMVFSILRLLNKTYKLDNYSVEFI